MTDQSGSSVPGWYHAAGDPPGTQRYWDGQQWRGQPQITERDSSAGDSLGPSPSMSRGFPEGSQAVTALLLSIFGFFCCGLPAGAGWYVAQQETQRIDQGLRDPANRSTATAAKAIGILAVVLWAALFMLLLFGAAVRTT